MIDRSVEPFVRELFNAAIVGDGARFEKALAAVPDDKAQDASNLLIAVDRVAMADLHEGNPSDERLKYLADEFAATQTWWSVEGMPVEGFLRSLVDPSATPIELGQSTLLSTLVGGWLLAAFLVDDAHWYEYLDDILNRLDAAQEM